MNKVRTEASIFGSRMQGKSRKKIKCFSRYEEAPKLRATKFFNVHAQSSSSQNFPMHDSDVMSGGW